MIHQKLITKLSLALAIGLIASACAAHIPAGKPQPAMESALYHLKIARKRLLQASPTKGGHRAKALRAVHFAIQQTKQGIVFDNNR